ncbi:MAG: decaprenyl-phosphate phosphoribosyltransferase [Bacteroidales bacterium]|jgi:4-hydroxybenzoate polyprenyltransferase|nr:decaprenyl-phosphate phosphoribosyltransferase [Bacteroidales bacterium]
MNNKTSKNLSTNSLTPPNIIQILRPQQWLKNAFVFLPLFFSGQLLHVELLWQCIVAFFAFSFVASAIYCLNDICDVEMDKLHPEKSHRPIASGAVSKHMAYLLMIACVTISITLLFAFSGTAKFALMALIGFYFGMNVAYCLKIKHIAIVDVLVIAIGFVLRVVVGGVATGIELSEWIVIMTFLLALFLAFAKRRDDVVLYESTGVSLRANTARYNLDFLNQVMTIISTITIVAYIMYTLSPAVIARFGSKYVYGTAIFVLIGIIRYLQLTIVDSKSGNPTKVLIRDRFLQCCIAGWILSFLLIIYVL